MAPPSQVIRQQLEILVDFLEENKEMFRGITPSKPMAQNVRDKWFTISEKLNAVENGCLKSPERWKKYWFEWRHRCRKKAAVARSCESKATRVVPLNDLEIRLLQVTDKGYMTSVTSPKTESFLAEDSDSQPLENIKVRALSIRKKKSRSIASSTRATQNNQISDDEFRSVSPPPKWALEIEERRIAAEERMAAALEAIASVMQSQEERQTMLHERLTDSVSSIAGSVQDLNTTLQEALLRLNQINPIQQNGVDCKGNFTL